MGDTILTVKTQKQEDAARLANNGLSHGEIAGHLAVGRAAVTRLLQRAAENGIVIHRRPRGRRPLTVSISQIGGETRRHIDTMLA